MTRTSAFGEACGLLLFVAALTVVSSAQSFKTLANFGGTSGLYPQSIVRGRDGNFWGTTAGNEQQNCGTVFKMTLGGVLTPVFTFNCTNGNDPQGLLVGADGSFYGSTFSGGSDNGGTIFKITNTGVMTILYNFTLDATSGSGPVGNLIQVLDGTFYGATYAGGTQYSYGTLFKISPKGILTTLYEFDFTHGAQPSAGMIQATNGDFYGTTYSGGAYAVGTVYKLTPNGVFTVLYNFGLHGLDPDYPVTSLVQGTDGNFYGATPYGGGTNNDGVIFKITPSGAFTTLHAFAESDGRSPGGLLQATDGNFYGTTAYGGANDQGTIFKIDSKGTLVTLHSFNATDGSNPFGLIQDTDGKLYGLTGLGGTANKGTAFRLDVGLQPFVQALTYSGKVGNVVQFFGQGFTSATTVSFNGIAATRSIKSSTYLTAVVPQGATTGFVTIATPNGTLTSNKKFRIIPQISSFSPSSGPGGTTVTITGVSLSGTTAITFGGIKATSFTITSDTTATAMVPTGAKTGKIGITTPGGIATTATNFTVLQ